MTTNSVTSAVLEVDRAEPFDRLRVTDETLRAAADAVLLEVDRFGISANNLGYVLLGDVLRSWDAFPSPTPGWGRVPVWGRARVLAAPQSVARVGATLTGYLPMATHVSVHAEPTESGLLTTDEPRAAMLPIYRRLTLGSDDATWGDHEADVDTAMLAVYRFAALLADDLERAGARAVVVSSASSRTAAALSRLLAGRGVEVTGLTSARHRRAVETFGVYHRVLAYDEVGRLPNVADAVYVDVAGSAEVTDAVRGRLGSRLAASIVVGATHLRAWPSTASVGPTATVFNTGDREVEVAAERGQSAVEALYGAARADLVPWASTWLTVTTVRGLAAAEETWRKVAAGQSDPLSAIVIRPGATLR